jgi:hypothetical protein
MAHLETMSLMANHLALRMKITLHFEREWSKPQMGKEFWACLDYIPDFFTQRVHVSTSCSRVRRNIELVGQLG